MPKKTISNNKKAMNSIKKTKITKKNSRATIKEIKFPKFILPKIIIPKIYYSRFCNNREKDIDISEMKFKFCKNVINLPKLNKNIKFHEKYIKKNEKSEKMLGDDRQKIVSRMTYDNFTSNKKIGYIPKKFYNIDINYGWTNAWRKMYEIIETCNLIDRNRNDKYNHFDICGFPGAFVFATNHYIKTKTKIRNYDWYIQSYNEKKTDEELTYLEDKFELQKKNPDRFLYGSAKSGFNGDITNVDNIREYIKMFKRQGLDLVTSDCGLQIVYEDSCSREKQMLKIHFGQFVCGIAILKKGGSFVMKNYSQMKPYSVSMIYLMTKLFREVILLKPESSRSYGNEIYLVCKDYYKNLNENQITDLINMVDEMDNSKHIDYMLIDNKLINKDEIKKIENILDRYYCRLEKIKIITRSIIDNEILKLKDDKDLLKKKIVHMNKSTESMIRYYFINYFKRMKYKRIENNDKL